MTTKYSLRHILISLSDPKTPSFSVMNVIQFREYHRFQLFGSIDRTISVVQNESKIDIYSFRIADANNMRNIPQEMLYCCCCCCRLQGGRNKTPVSFVIVDASNVRVFTRTAWPKILRPGQNSNLIPRNYVILLRKSLGTNNGTNKVAGRKSYYRRMAQSLAASRIIDEWHK